MSILTVSGLSRRYGSTYAVKDLNLSVQAGNVYGILGPNGSGKSTTLAMILGVTRPSSGSYEWFDGQYSPALARRHIGSILERPNFYHHLSGFQNLKLTCAIRGRGTSAGINAVLDEVALGTVKNNPFNSYSLGMRQRLALAAALAGDTEVLVLDEPTNGIDAQGIADVRETILDVASQGKTIILASHILDEVQKVCSHISILKAGRVVESGPIDRVLGTEEQVEVASYDLEGLLQVLKTLEYVEHINRHPDFFSVRLKPGSDIAEFNTQLVRAGQAPCHLNRSRLSLESRYLQVTGEQ